MPLITHTVTLQTEYPGGEPLDGIWTTSVYAFPPLAKDTLEHNVIAGKDPEITVDGLAVLELEETGQPNLVPGDFRWQISFVSRDRNTRLGPYIFELTEDMTLDEIAESSGVPVTSSILEQAVAAADAADADAVQTALDRAAVEAIGTTNDGLIAGRVADSASLTHAALTADFVAEGSHAWDVRKHGVPLDGTTLADTALDALLAQMSPGDTLLIPHGAAIKLATRRDIGERIVIEGNDATIVQASTTGVFRFVAGSDRSKVRNLKGVGPSGTVFGANSNFIKAEGTVGAYLDGITVENVRGEAWGNGNFEAHWTRNIVTRDVYTKNCYYHGQHFLSCEDITLHNPMCDTLAGFAATSYTCYPVAFTRDSNLSLAAAPRTRNATVHGGWARNTPWEGLDGHGAINVKVFGYHTRNTLIGIDFTRCPDPLGVPTWAAIDCWAFGCTAESTVSDGSKRDGFMLVGTELFEKATGGFIGCTSIGHGDQSNASAGGFYLLDTDRAQLGSCESIEGSSNGLMVDQRNTDVMVNGFDAVDPWSTVQGGVAGMRLSGVGQSVTLNGFRVLARAKAATNLRNGGIRAATGDTTSRIYLGAGNNLTGAAAAFAGSAGGLIRSSMFGATPAAQPAANPDTSGATLAALETEVNQMKASLRTLGMLAP